MRGAPGNFRDIRIAVSVRWNREGQLKAIERFKPLERRLTDPEFPKRGHGETLWRVWMSRPFRRRIEHYSPPETLSMVSAADEYRSWFYFPSDRAGNITRNTEVDDLAVDSLAAADFTTWLHPEVAELLDPSFIWAVWDDNHQDPTLEPLGSASHLNRPALRARLHVRDWETRTDLGETLWVADDYELIVDEATGVLLRVACKVDGEEFHVTEVEEIVFGQPLDPSLLKPPAIERWL
jgi:hypothetical protein